MLHKLEYQLLTLHKNFYQNSDSKFILSGDHISTNHFILQLLIY